MTAKTTATLTTAQRDRCVLNRCDRQQGIGTWCDVAGRDKPQPVCEEHWQALRAVEFARRDEARENA